MRPRQLRRRLVLSGVALPVLAFAATLGVAEAQADPNSGREWEFVKSLDVYGIGYTSEQGVIAAGYAVCGYMKAGFSEAATVDMVREATGLDELPSSFFVDAAQEALCPSESDSSVGGGVSGSGRMGGVL